MSGRKGWGMPGKSGGKVRNGWGLVGKGGEG